MPIGKNALKRVSNSGYSNVQTKAPDMENSEVVEKKAEEKVSKVAPVAEKKTAPKEEAKKAPAKKATATKTVAKAPTPKKSMEKELDFAPVKTAEKIISAPLKADEFGHICIGEDLPYYLL